MKWFTLKPIGQLLVVMLTFTQTFCSQGYADVKDVHAAAHIGTAYAIQTFGYGFAKKGLRLDTEDAIVFSAFSTMMLSAVWEMAGHSKPSGSDLFHDFAGVGLSVGTCLMYEF